MVALSYRGSVLPWLKHFVFVVVISCFPLLFFEVKRNFSGICTVNVDNCRIKNINQIEKAQNKHVTLTHFSPMSHFYTP